MARKWSSVLLTGLLSLTVGCQPEAQAPALETRAEALDGEVGAWSPTSSKAYSYPSTSAVLLSGTGEVLDTYYGFVQRYNPYTNTWRAMKPMCSAGYCSTTSLRELPSGRVLATVILTGRMGGTPVLMTYAPDTDTWTQSGAPYSRGSVTLLDSGKVLLMGGYTYQFGTKVTLGSVTEYDPATETWSQLPGSMITPRSGHSATLLYSGKVLVTGGTASDGTTLASAEIYDPATGAWTAAGNMSHARGDHRAFRLYSGYVMILSDSTNSSETSVDLYDPHNARWLMGPALPFTQPSSATLLYSGEVLVVNNAGQAAIYSPSQNAWLPAASATSSTLNAATVLLQTGEVLRLNGSSPVAEWFTR